MASNANQTCQTNVSNENDIDNINIAGGAAGDEIEYSESKTDSVSVTVSDMTESHQTHACQTRKKNQDCKDNKQNIQEHVQSDHEQKAKCEESDMEEYFFRCEQIPRFDFGDSRIDEFISKSVS